MYLAVCKKLSSVVGSFFLSLSLIAQNYTPSASNLAARTQFQDNKYGMFIHWGLSSILADGEWIMNNRNIKVADYKQLLPAFYPSEFNAEQWVQTAKKAGMKYIVFITRHHDSFSNWDTKFSDWKITNTPFKRDVLKELAGACKKEGMQLGLYYSTLDWFREDYPHKTGRTGQGTGRKGNGDYNAYFQFMKNQLTELLTNYGEIMSIWLDGHWDQTNEEGTHDRTSRIDWRYDELYNHIHSLQPQCMIGNNHHLTPFEGEDFQMFERDLPGENKSGLSYQKASLEVPLETCETINGSWGYNITDRRYKTVKEVIQLQVGAAGRNANLLLNVGPMSNGLIQPEFVDTLAVAGEWLAKYGETIYGTRGGPIVPQPWGVSTQKGKKIYLHVFRQPFGNLIVLPAFREKVKQVQLFINRKPVSFKQQAEGLLVSTEGINLSGANEVIEIELK